MPFKVDQNIKSKPFNRFSPESEKRKKVDMQTLAKIQATAIFLMEDMRRNVFPKFIEICMEKPCWCPPKWTPTWRPEPAETSATKFCYKSENRPLEELKNITIILYSNTRTVQIVKFPEISHFLNQHHNSLPSCNCHVTQKLRNSSVVYH